ncbi:LysM peptidoglycan-binding domain-containing protein [Streptomyces sp. NPDC020412]|uniref:LysM peptidoglycan-binding domain-containing protein n=1 Tax=Streptomyces sp. NPDC020412 TaxID=3365073 RepID=UPI003790F76B
MGDTNNDVSGRVDGPLVQARTVGDLHFHNAMLRAELPGGAVVGREEELQRIVSLVDRGRRGLVVAGPVGGGVDSLVSTAARELCRAGRFPGGMLEVEFHGHPRLRAASAHDEIAAAALRTSLAALGVPETEVPREPSALGAAYRSQLADHEAVLVVLRHVGAREEVLRFWEAGGEHKVLVGGHGPVADGDLLPSMDVAPLPVAECVELLETVIGRGCLGDARVADDPDAAARLVALGGGLPLAVALLAGVLAADPGMTLDALARRLESLRTAAAPAERGPLRAVWEVAAQELPPTEAEVLRAVALADRPVLDAEAVRTAAAVSLTAAEDALHGLARRHLLHGHMEGSKRVPGRHRMHSAVRHFAARRDGSDASPSAPPPAPCVTAVHTYTVQPGDTLSRIGARFHVNWQHVALRNRIVNPDLIYPGEVFVLR